MGIVFLLVVAALLLAGTGGRLPGVRLPLPLALLIGSSGAAVGVVSAYPVYRRHAGSTAAVVGVGWVRRSRRRCCC